MSLTITGKARSVVGITPAQKSVLMALADYANEKTGSCFPSYQEISVWTCLSRRSVISAIQDLSVLGLIIIENRARGNGSASSNNYTISIPEPNSKRRLDLVREVHEVVKEVHHPPSATVSPGGERGSLGGATVSPGVVRDLHPHNEKIEQEVNDYSTFNKVSAGRDSVSWADEILGYYRRRENMEAAKLILVEHIDEGDDPATIIEGTKAMGKAYEALPSGWLNIHVPAATTFFRNKQWKNDPATVRNKGPNGNDPNRKKTLQERDFEKTGYRTEIKLPRL